MATPMLKRALLALLIVMVLVAPLLVRADPIDV